MITDKEYGSFLEIKTFCDIFKIKISVYTRNITDEKCQKTNKDSLTLYITGEKYVGNFGLILEKYEKS